MAIYFIAYIIILVLALNQDRTKQNLKILAVWTILICLICGLRDMLGGYDSYIYAEVFDVTSDEIDRQIDVWKTPAIELNSSELGYGFYNVLLAFLTANRYIFLFITTILIYISLYHHVCKLSKYPHLTFFILFCMWYFFSFTYIRQVMAACIAWYAIPYAISRKPVPFFTIVLVAVSFHNSALLFFAVYFLAEKKFTKQQIFYFSLLSLLVGLTPIGHVLFDILGGAVNEAKADLANKNDSGRLEYVLEAGFFLFLIYNKYDDIAKTNKSLCMLNIALLFIFTLTLFVRFSDGGRMSWYFLIGIANTTAQLSMKNKKNLPVKLITIIMMTLLYFRIIFSWGIYLSPYKTFLTNGDRINDPISERYEYDANYAKDKFYRAPLKIFNQ